MAIAPTDLCDYTSIVSYASGNVIRLAGGVGPLVPGMAMIVESQHGHNEAGIDGSYTWDSFYRRAPSGAGKRDWYLGDHLTQGKSFMGDIVSISGNDITLDRTISSAAIGLPFYVDCGPAIKAAIEANAAWEEGKTYYLTARQASLNGTVRPSLSHAQQTRDFNFCTFKAARGCWSWEFNPAHPLGGSPNNKVWKNLTLHGNWLSTGGFVPPINQPGDPVVWRCVGANHLFDNVNFVDQMTSFSFHYAVDSVLQNSTYTNNSQGRRYFQWHYGTSSGCKRCVFYNCTVDSDWYCPAFEAFDSTGVVFDKCGGRNCTWSHNTSGKTIFKDCYTNWDDDNVWVGDATYHGWSQFGHIMDANANIESQQGHPHIGTEGGVLVENFRFEYQKLPWSNPSASLGANNMFRFMSANARAFPEVKMDARLRNITYINPFPAATAFGFNSSGYVLNGGSGATETKVYGPNSVSVLNEGVPFAIASQSLSETIL